MEIIDIAPQAIDQASNRVSGIWMSTRFNGAPGNENEGLRSWLERTARLALSYGEKLESGKFRYGGIKFTFLAMAVKRGNQQHQGWLLQTVERVK